MNFIKRPIYICLFLVFLLNLPVTCKAIDVTSGKSIDLTATASDEDCNSPGDPNDCGTFNQWVTITWTDNTGRSTASAFPEGNSGSPVKWSAPKICDEWDVEITATADDLPIPYAGHDDYAVTDSTTVHVVPQLELGSWEFLSPPKCPPTWDVWFLFDHEWKWYDKCGNTLKISCYKADNCYKFWYNNMIVGKCVWIGGGNLFYRKLSADNMRFLATEHASCNDAIGVDEHGEGCEGYWCVRKTEYEYPNVAGVSVTWIRTEQEECPCSSGMPSGGGGWEECPVQGYH